jgi:hypothetical protein
VASIRAKSSALYILAKVKRIVIHSDLHRP